MNPLEELISIIDGYWGFPSDVAARRVRDWARDKSPAEITEMLRKTRIQHGIK
jgi:hypothetical protein